MVLWFRLVQVQIVRHEYYTTRADRQSVTEREVPAVRGAIFDRRGRPLALSADLYSVGVSPSVVDDADAVATAVGRVLGLSRSSIRRKIRSGGGFFYIARQCDLREEQRERLRGIKGVSVSMEPGRVYPYGSVAAKLVGFVGYDNDGQSGVEVAFDGELSGVPGMERVIRNGRYQTERYYRSVQKRPRNGRHLYLTIDVAVQEIAEGEIERAVAEHAASSGVVIVMEVETGDVLALAEYPAPRSRALSARADSLWTIRSLSHVYEPGSTFKVVTAAALLESGRVTPSDLFDAENGRADLGFATITDPHPHEMVTFAEAFAYSSNVVMAKASRLVSADTFYRVVRLFGFGAKTGVLLAGESAGKVSEVSSWSGRTQSTMAFGQEVAVTPLQMLAAYGAVANDGEMMMPRLVKGIADDTSGDVVRFEPVRVRRVVSRGTAGTLLDMCRHVVEYGTGQKAAVDFMRVSGKTGTGQKALPRGGYSPGKVTASFIGIAPHDDPRIVCLVLLDEPRWASRYGGDSAAPVFARICRSIANGTDLFDGALSAETVTATDSERRRALAPNFLRMDRAAALECARRLGANVLCQGDEGRVVSQDPSPGASMNKDDVIRLTVASDRGGSHQRRTPDLRGLTMRRAKRLAAEHGFTPRFVGSGVVQQQSPRPGKETGYRYVKLYCATGATGGGSR
jgi:cell division protein FtsI/penicillin-binding protein 2